MRPPLSLLLAAACALCTAPGCGTSADRASPRPANPAPDAAGVEDAKVASPVPSPQTRTLRTAALLGTTSVENLLIDPKFGSGEFGIGRWLSSFGSSLASDGPPIGQVLLSDSPEGVALDVGTLYDVPEKGPPRSMMLAAQVVGGNGPYVGRVWISFDPAPGEQGSPLSLVRVTLAAATAVGLAGVDFKPEEASTRRIGPREWTRFVVEVPGPFSLGAWMLVRFKGSKHRFYLQAPEVVPKALLPAVPETRSWSPSAAGPVVRRPLDADELAAIDRYRRMPVRSGLLPPPPQPRVPPWARPAPSN